jgi:RecA-family ATPase
MKQDANSIVRDKGIVHLRNAIDVAVPVKSTPTKPPQRKNADKPSIFAAPYAWRDPSTIPPRDWLYARHYVRGFVTATIAPGGMGKSSLAFAEAVAMCTGKNLLGHPVRKPLRVWVWNGEDPAVELERRVAAICLHFGIDHAELAGRLFLNSGRDMPIRLAEMAKGEVRINQAQIDGIRDECRKRKIDVLIIDPWVSAHSLPESANMEIDRVIKAGVSVIAEQANIAAARGPWRRPGASRFSAHLI